MLKPSNDGSLNLTNLVGCITFDHFLYSAWFFPAPSRLAECEDSEGEDFFERNRKRGKKKWKEICMWRVLIINDVIIFIIFIKITFDTTTAAADDDDEDEFLESRLFLWHLIFS